MGVDGPLGHAAGATHHRVLLLVRPFTEGGAETCAHLSVRGLGRDDALIVVPGGGTPDDRLRSLRAHADGPLPSRLGFLTFDDRPRSSATTEGAEDRDVWVGTAASPGNLTDIGVTMSDRLSRWSGDGGAVAVCFEPITALLQYSTVGDVYRFMHVLGQQVGAADGRIHYHLDPTAHDPTVVNQLKTLCDAVVELDADGDVDVLTRG